MAYMGVGYSGYEYETCPLCGQGCGTGGVRIRIASTIGIPKMMKKARKICEKDL